MQFSHGAEELTLRGEREADWWQSSYLWSSQAQQAAATSTAAVGRRLARRPPIGAPTGGLRALCRASNHRGAVCNNMWPVTLPKVYPSSPVTTAAVSIAKDMRKHVGVLLQEQCWSVLHMAHM